MIMRKALRTVCAALLLVIIAGCAQQRADLFSTNPAISANGQAAGNAAALGQLQEMNSRLAKTDADNRELHAQIAQLQQQLNLSNEEKRLLRQQMADTAGQLRNVQMAKNEVDNRLNVMRTSTQTRSGATVRANNSLADRINAIKTTGVEVRQDGDVVRIDLPTDRLFVQGTYQLQQNGTALLDQVATEIRRNYPRQMIGIEGHTDNVPIAGTVTTHHQIAATQSMTILDYLSRSGYLPERQMFAMAVGSNQPRFSNGDPAGRARNRRIEIVIYPEVFEGG